MKKLLRLMLAAMLLLSISIVPVSAEGSQSTALRFGSAKPVVAITAYFDVLTEDVESISVTFDPDVAGNAYANYIPQDHQLRISVASLTAIDLSKPVGTAVAVLRDGSFAAPVLRLTLLKYDGAKAESSLIPLEVSGHLRNGMLTVGGSLREDLKGTYTLYLSAYDESGRMVAIKTKSLTLEKETQAFEVEFGKCPTAVKVKAFFLTENRIPCAASLEGTVQTS